jgi:hypothetical protein
VAGIFPWEAPAGEIVKRIGFALLPHFGIARASLNDHGPVVAEVKKGFENQ